MTKLKDETSLLVYDFAHGGDTTDGVERQIKNEYLPAIAAEVSRSFLRNVLSRSQRKISWATPNTMFSEEISISFLYVALTIF